MFMHMKGLFCLLPSLLIAACLLTGCPEGEDKPVESTGPKDVVSGTALDVSLSDGTRLELPAIEASGPITQLTLNRMEGSVDLSALDLEAVGKTRMIEFDSFDPVQMGFPAARVAPQITLPAATADGLDKNTVVVYRVADLYLGDQSYPAHGSCLPVTWAPNGDLVVTDFYFADSIMSDLALNEAVKSGRFVPSAGKATMNPRRIQYVAGTFNGSYNWLAEPILLRFYPEQIAIEERVSWEQLSDERQEEEDKRIESNIVILVHGHNEEEKLGYAPTSAPYPWNYAYKRDVWTKFYEYVSESVPEIAECTGFYEFVYPTYWPAFARESGTKRLDEAFAEAVNHLIATRAELNPQVKLYIVAHSMGGLVARAGIQLFESTTNNAFQRLVTWGSPHLGSPLVTVRYVMGAPRGIYRAGPDGVVNFPLGNIDNTLFALRRAVDNEQVDAPGTRDLRWANSHTDIPRGLAIDSLFSFDQVAAGDPDLWNKYSLDNGTEIYNQNLNLLNTNDTYRNSDKYHAVIGVTTRRAILSFPISNWFKPTLDTTGPPLGAKIMPWLMDGPDDPYLGHKQGSSDGAVPITSMAGAGVTGRQTDVGDIDHEQYYGAPNAAGFFQAPDLAIETSANTIAIFGMTCPPPGQRTFNLSRTGEPVSLGSVEHAPYPMTLKRSVTMDITVNFEGGVPPILFDDTVSPNVKKIHVTGYKDPVTIMGSYNFSVTPTEWREDWPSAYVIYKIKKSQFQHYGVNVGRHFEDPIFLNSGAFTWTFTQDPSDPFQPRFFPGMIRLTYEIKYYFKTGDELYKTEEKTFDYYVTPPLLKVEFGLG